MAIIENGELSCPRCGLRQPVGVECVRCGVIFRKFAAPGIAVRPRPAAPPRPGPPGSPASSPNRALGAGLLVSAAAAAALWAWLGRAPSGTEPAIALAPPVAATAAPQPPAPSSVLPRSPAQGAGFTQSSTRIAPFASTSSAPATNGSPAEPPAPVRMPYSWYEGASGYQAAVAEARDDHKPMTVYFRTDWCPYCRELDSELLRAGPVVDYLRSVVKVRINPEAGAEEHAIARRYGVTGFPSLYVHRPAEPSATKVSSHIAEQDGWRMCTPEEFVALYRRVLQGAG